MGTQEPFGGGGRGGVRVAKTIQFSETFTKSHFRALTFCETFTKGDFQALIFVKHSPKVIFEH
jgi:hypothetical protein